MAEAPSASGKARVDLPPDRAVAELVLSAPPLNLFDEQMVADVEVALERLHGLVADRQVRAVLFRAEGKVFCGGVDVHEFQNRSIASGTVVMDRFFNLTKAMAALPVPTVAVVHALNLTIGMELALGCDMMWAAEDAQFGLVEATVGLTPGAGGTQRLAARAGVARAAEFVMTGDVYPARELYEWGVINRLRPREQLLDDARAFVARLAAGPTLATAEGKRILTAAAQHGLAAADAITTTAAAQAFGTEDLAAGVESLLTRGPRQATFSGR